MTGELVGAHSADQGVIRIISHDGVIGGIAGAVDSSGSGEGEIFQISTQRVGHARLHQIGAGARVLVGRVTDVVHDVGVITTAADHRVGASQTIQHVVAGIPDHSGGQRLAGPVDGATTLELEVFDSGA